MLAPDQLTLVLRHLTPARVIDGCAALTLPFDEDGRPDLEALAALVQQTYASGLTPAVSTLAGYVDLLTDDERCDVLAVTAGVARGRRFLAGALPDTAGSGSLAERYAVALARVRRQGGTPLLWPCAELTTLDEDAIADLHREATRECPGAIAVEIAPTLLAQGRVYSLDLFQRLTDVPTLAGLYHASLSRVSEWYRVEARDARRPEFRLYSGHELAIDMPAYGSDYLLAGAGLLPDAFRTRDRLWTAGDARVTDLNDALQYVCSLTFRAPMAAARHAAAQVLALRGATPGSSPHPASARRPDADLDLLRDALERLDALLRSASVEPPFPLSAARR
jgi:dihydrodipicolinate synthase/N-acetylneuraminate lyase